MPAPHRFPRAYRRASMLLPCVALACAIGLASTTVHAQARKATAKATKSDTTHHYPRWWPSDVGFAIGPGIGWQRYADQVSGQETSFTPVGGFFRGSKVGPEAKSGFVPAFSVTIFPTKIGVVATDANATALGTIKLRPMMVGIGWFHPIGRSVSARLNVLGGWSFNGLGEVEDAKRRPMFQVSAAPTAVGSNATWETSGRLWFNTSPRVAFITGLSHIRARPELTLTDGSRRALNADRIRLDAGVAFTVFHWRRGDAGK